MSRNDYHGRPLQKAIGIASASRSTIWKQLNSLTNSPHNLVDEFELKLHGQISTSISMRYTTYMEINPNLMAHPIYGKHSTVLEYKRISLTRLRLSSHHLKVETGRWSRLPRPRRLCTCGDVQDDHRILLRCPLTNHLRDREQIHVTT